MNEKVCSATRISIVDGRKFLETMTHEHVFFAIVCKDGKAEAKEVPAKIVDLLEEFPDIVLDNVPDGLPLVWKISHQMDLIPKTSYQTRKCIE